MTQRFFYQVFCDEQSRRFEPLYFDSFCDASSYVQSLLNDNCNYPVSIVKVSFNFG